MYKGCADFISMSNGWTNKLEHRTKRNYHITIDTILTLIQVEENQLQWESYAIIWFQFHSIKTKN